MRRHVGSSHGLMRGQLLFNAKKDQKLGTQFGRIRRKSGSANSSRTESVMIWPLKYLQALII